jgi:hypothetical protein
MLIHVKKSHNASNRAFTASHSKLRHPALGAGANLPLQCAAQPQRHTGTGVRDSNTTLSKQASNTNLAECGAARRGGQALDGTGGHDMCCRGVGQRNGLLKLCER